MGASPQLEKGYLRIANELFDEILKRDFTKRQLSIILFIIRFSYGCQRKQTLKLKFSDFQQCGIYSQNIKKELRNLKQNRIIFHDEETNIFSVNKNYEQWFMKYCPEYEEIKFNKIIKTQLEGLQHKEKENKPSEAQQNFNEQLKYAGRWE